MLVREGLEDVETWESILSFSIQNGDDRDFMKFYNTALNFVGEESNDRTKILRKLIEPQKFKK